MAKGKMKAKSERRCARCQKVYMAMLQNRVSHHSDDTKKSGNSLALQEICVVHRCDLRCSDVVHLDATPPPQN